jgi:integrase
MSSSYDVRVQEIHKRYDHGSKKPTRYIVRWTVNRKRNERGFKLRTQADSFRSELMTAARKGEPFDTATGLPLAVLRSNQVDKTWFELATAYCATRWDELSAGSRRNLARDLSDVTAALLPAKAGRPARATLGKALRMAFNPRTSAEPLPEQFGDAITWVKRHGGTVRDLEDVDAFRRLMAALDKKGDGTRAAPDTIRLRRAALNGVLDYAIEKDLLEVNPLKKVKVRKNRTAIREVDSAAVVSPMQARTLLNAVRENSPRLVAFFGLMYFAGLRPEEAVNVRKSNLSLPPVEWNGVRERWSFPAGVDGGGELRLERAVPEISGEWTDSGQRHEERSLKGRGEKDTRTVPCWPDLTILLHDHLRRFGTAPDGRLFWGARSGGRLSSSVYGRAWADAREATFTPDVFASPLGKRPYDLRHACVSGWLAAGVEPTRVAYWAGHSVAVLMKVYAKFIDGGQAVALRRVGDWLGRNP